MNMITLNFTTVTPLLICNGNELGFELDYIVKNDVFCKLNFLKIAGKLKDKFNFNRDYTLENILSLVHENISLFNNNDYEYKMPITKGFLDHINNERAIGRKFVNEFVNSNGKFYVPGSSIKGALLTALNVNSLGIQAGTNADIKDKFVIRDSEFIDSSNFIIHRTVNRPPALSVQCLKPDITFSLKIMKTGKLEISNLKQKLREYSQTQIELAKKQDLNNFKSRTDVPKGADLFELAIGYISNITLSKDEYLINIGFGGGSWFKIEKNGVPMFRSKSPRRRGQWEPAHTTFSVKKNDEYLQLGWCKLKIIEE